MDLVRTGLVAMLAAGAAVAYLFLSAKQKDKPTSGPRSKLVQKHSADGLPLGTRQVGGVNIRMSDLLTPQQNRPRPPLEILYPGPADGTAEVE